MNEPKKFRKKPVVILAIQLDKTNAEKIAEWCGGATWMDKMIFPVEDRITVVYIETLEGVMWADIGDWIIKGIKGEFYPCKPDIFDATYETA